MFSRFYRWECWSEPLVYLWVCTTIEKSTNYSGIIKFNSKGKKTIVVKKIPERNLKKTQHAQVHVSNLVWGAYMPLLLRRGTDDFYKHSLLQICVTSKC